MSGSRTTTPRRHVKDEVALYRRSIERLASAGQLVAARVGGSTDGLVAVLDLDGFSRVNGRYGVDVGDALLVRVEQSLVVAAAGRGDACALGGDQFVVVMPGPQDPRAAAEVLLRAVRRTSVRAALFGRARVTATAGFARWPEHGQTAGAVLAAADHAQRVAKADHRGGWAVCSPSS